MTNTTCHGTLNAVDVDAAIWESIKAILLDPQSILGGLQQRQSERNAAVTVLKDRLETVEKQIASLTNQQAKLLELFLDENALLPKEVLTTKNAEINESIARFRTEATDLRKQIERTAIDDKTLKNVAEFCKKVCVGIEHFTFEDKLKVIDTLEVTGIVRRAESGTVFIVLSGFLPDIAVDASDFCGHTRSAS